MEESVPTNRKKKVAIADPVVTAEQLAHELGTCTQTIRRWTNAKKIPVLRMGRSFVRYRRADVFAVLEK